MKRVALTTMAVMLTASLTFAQPPRGDRGDRGDRGPGGPGGFRPPNPLMMIFDGDQDGELSKEEIAKAADALAKLDKNEDGKLTEDELPRPQRPQFGGPGGGRPGQGRPGQGGPGGNRPSMADRIKEMDKNGDGAISKDELPEQFADRMLERLDENKDGKITKEEFEAAAQRFGNRGRGGPGGGRPGEGRPGGGDRPRRPGGDGEDGGRRPRRPERPDA